MLKISDDTWGISAIGKHCNTLVISGIVIREYENGIIIRRFAKGVKTMEICLQDWQAGEVALRCRKWSQPVLKTPHEIEEMLRNKLLEGI